MASRTEKTQTRRQLDPEFDRRLGKLLRTRRHQLGWSQQQLADRLGLTFQQVQKYENGRNQLTVSRLLQICEVTNVSASYFLEANADSATPAKVDFSTARAIAALSSAPVKQAFLRLARECERVMGQPARRRG